MAIQFSETDLKKFEYIQQKLGISLNEGQRMLALPSDKPKLCSAVPGSGKTTALGIAVTCEEVIGRVAGNKMHVMTFTNKATNEFKFRHMNIMSRLGLKSNVNVSTIHAMCKKYVEIFHEKLGMMQVTTMTEEESRALLKRIVATIKNKNENQISINEVVEIERCISFLDNRLYFKKEEVMKTYQFISLGMKYEEFEKIRDIYTSSQRRSGKLSFDEWMMCFYEILKNHKDIRETIQSQLDSLFVDEFQDTTILQFEIIDMMKSPTAKLTAVGDQDQSIYRWRGASNVYKRFIERHSDYEHIKMNINYRCPDYVIDSSNALIRNNTQRLEVKAVGTGKRGKLEIIPTKSNQVASLEIAKVIIQEYIDSGKDNNILTDKLILYRNHSQGMFMVYELASREIPIITSGVGLPHKDKIVRDLLDIIHFLDNPRNSALTSKCMHMVVTQLNKPKNKEKCPYFTSDEKLHFAEIPVSVRNPKEYEDELRKLVEISKMVRERKPAREIFTKLLPMYMSAYYRKYNLHNLMGKTEEDVQAIERFLMHGVKKDYDIDQFRHMLIKVEQFVDRSNQDQVGLKIYSIHGAKGLEAKQVYLLDVNGIAQPNPKVIETLKEAKAWEAIEDYINEERSLFFVAITRTLQDLTVTYNKDNPSPFNWESGLNDKLRAMFGVLSMESLGIKLPAHQQQTQQGRTDNMATAQATKEQTFRDQLPESVRELFNQPTSTEAETLDEISKISDNFDTMLKGLERRKVSNTKTRLASAEIG